MKTSLPTQRQMLSKDGMIDSNWYIYLTQLNDYIAQNTQAGTTAQRPVENLYAGRRYFDTSLGANGKPIWVNKGATGWVLADGTAA